MPNTNETTSPTYDVSGTRPGAATGQHMAARDSLTALNKGGTIVMDVRTPAEYTSGHLPKPMESLLLVVG
jgi:predicted sulfurtransferase